MARIIYAQLIPPAVPSSVPVGSAKALDVLGSSRNGGPPRCSLKALKMVLNFCGYSCQLKRVGGILQNILSAKVNLVFPGNSNFIS